MIGEKIIALSVSNLPAETALALLVCCSENTVHKIVCVYFKWTL